MQKTACKNGVDNVFNTGKVTFATIEAKNAMRKASSIQVHLPSCRNECELTYKFYAEPKFIEDCDDVTPAKWKAECIKRTKGEIVFS